MPKVYQLILNSKDALSGSTTSNAKYYVDWASFLPDGEYNVSFTYTSGSNTLNTSKYPVISINSLYASVFTSSSSSGAPSSLQIGYLKQNLITSTTMTFQADLATNSKLYIKSRPLNNNFNVCIFDNSGSEFLDSATGGGTATLSGTTLTIATQTSGTLYLGTKLTLSSVDYLITSFGTGTGGIGTYTVNKSGSVGTAAAYTTSGNPPASYILNLAFEKLNH